VFDGGSVDQGAGAVRVRPAGLFRAEDEVRGLAVGAGRGGPPVRLGDVAAVERRYADPAYAARVDGAPAVLMSVEMQEGRNIVAFGADLERALAAVRPLLPADLVVERVADQPTQVRHRVLEFGREFAIAVASVILVTVLLLPLRVAAIAALAIPATVAVTVAVLNAVGIELHQISFAGLVVALGMVVDDAIVIADNYVELLDEGVPRADAAWRSASDLAGPVLGATLTIVASFLPLGVLLPGTVGEFIRALPFTVAVALLTSFGVAMFLTPLLCLAFIRTGLRPGGAPAGHAPPRRRTPLDRMQGAYEWAMARAMPRPRLTLALAAASVAAGGVLLATRPQRFFPPAERPQFVVDVWMPEGTRFAATDTTVARLGAALRRTPGVVQTAAFVGGSSPRFYYNVEPEFNVPNFGQLVVNTADARGTPALQASLHGALARLAPEATVIVRQLEQGPALRAPIEVRYSGEDGAVLRRLADEAARVLAATPGSEYVRTDWREDQPGLRLALRREAAARLGLTEADVAQQLAAGLDGAPASTFWEGTRRVDVRLRFDSLARRGAADVGDAYVTAPATGARVPLRAVADLRPEWAPSRIVRRNGVRTVSVLAHARPDVLASTVLAAATPALDRIPLPAGYTRALGGEAENQGEVQGPMGVALAVSQLAIFLILVLQFRTVRHPLVVMVSIPLALFGSALGLVLTGNPFGFTANLGLTALTGVVVRNAIILVDYALARRREGEPLDQAALDAGRRRLRPIFLTTMAAAVGVVPLIASGSGLWSPLASVLAVGLVCSMVGTLVVVPVLFVLVERRAERRAAARATRAEPARGLAFGAPTPAAAAGALLLALAAGAPAAATAQEVAAAGAGGAGGRVVRLTLDEALARAAGAARGTRIAAARADERRALARGARAAYLPQLTASGQFLGRTGDQRVDVPQGALGTDGAGRPLPFGDRTLTSPGGAAYYGFVTLAQPVTQLVGVRAGARAAAAAARAGEAEQEVTRLDVALGVERLYLAALAADRRLAAAAALAAARELRLTDAARSAAAGFALDADRREARAGALEARQALVAAANDAEDARTRLAELLALPDDARLELAEPAPLASLGSGAGGAADGAGALAAAAARAHPEVRAARAQAEAAARGVDGARAAYLPELAVFAQYSRQTFVSLLPRDLVTGGVRLAWTGWDWGRRASDVEAAVARRRAAEEDRARAEARVAAGVRTAYRAAVRAERLEEAASAAAEARADAARVVRARAASGLTLASARAEAEAAALGAEAARYAATAAARIARAELRRAAGGDGP
jgi:multidrug efflux pump subunit AcrB/outer membrane protein TolC